MWPPALLAMTTVGPLPSHFWWKLTGAKPSRVARKSKLPVQCLEGHDSCWIQFLSFWWSSLLRIWLSNMMWSSPSSRNTPLWCASLEHKSSHSSKNPAWYSRGKVFKGGPWTVDPGGNLLISTNQLSNALNCTGSKSKKIRPSRSFGRTLSQRPLNNWDKREPSMAVKVSRLVTKLVSPPTFNLSGIEGSWGRALVITTARKTYKYIAKCILKLLI